MYASEYKIEKKWTEVNRVVNTESGKATIGSSRNDFLIGLGSSEQSRGEQNRLTLKQAIED